MVTRVRWEVLGITNQIWFDNIRLNVYGFRLRKVKIIFCGYVYLEERQLAVFLTVSAKSSFPLYTRAGK